MSYPKFYYTDEEQNTENQHPNFKKAAKIFQKARNIYQSDVHVALKGYKKALSLIPGSAFLLTKIFSAYMALGDKDLAKQYLEQALEADPTQPILISHIPDLYDLQNEDIVNYIDDVREYLSNEIPAVNAAMLHYGLSRLYSKLGDTQREWNNLKMHNDLMFEVTLQTSHYNFFDFLTLRDGYIAAGKPIEISSNQSSKPLFIVSLPRSGSTLLDQILTSHSKIESLGESYNIDRVLSQIDNQNIIESLNITANGYLQALDSTYPDARYVIDKMPTNYWNVRDIKQLYPNAKIIICLRNPIAMGLSCYKERLGGVGTWEFCNSLEEIGKYYSHVFKPLVDHWSNIFPDDVYFVQYEDIVTDFDETINSLLNFLNLDFEEKQRNFHELDRGVTTISREQVKQPLFNKLDAWKKYEPYLSELKYGLENKEIKRLCGTCTACCVETEFNTPEFSKEYMKPCQYLCETGCGIYEKRFPVCKEYNCLWLQGYGTEIERPNITGIISNITTINGGTWVSVRELGEDALTTTGKSFVIDLVIKHQIPIIVREFGSKHQEGTLVVVKEELLPRSKQIIGDFVGWLNDKENIGIYKLVNSG